MSRQALLKRFRDRFGDNIDVSRNPEVIDEIVAWSKVASEPADDLAAGPFRVPWMDSLVAHWVFAKQRETAIRGDPADTLMATLVEARFRERLAEIAAIVGGAEPPDGGPPEPGVPPVGPEAFVPPDGGTPEPGVPPVGPAVFEPPDGGPPEPGTPPAGPSGGFGELTENPWILYWFLSIRAPMLLDIVDLHIDRRLQEISERAGRR